MSRIMLLLFIHFALPPLGSHGAQVSCPTHPAVVITDPGSEAVPELCQAAAKALHFLAGYDLVPRHPIRVEIVERKLAGNGYDAFGCYDSRSDLIQLMSYRAIAAESPAARMYGETFDREHYAGAVAHEIAHAVVQHNLRVKLISPGPQEYLAHATQMAVLPPAKRGRIIAAMAVEPWRSGDVISEIYAAMAPGKFAVKSYTHLTGMAAPRAFVQILLKSKWFYVTVP